MGWDDYPTEDPETLRRREEAARADIPGAAHRRAMVRALLEAWDRHPEWRLGQLVANASNGPAATVYYLRDGDILRALRILAKP